MPASAEADDERFTSGRNALDDDMLIGSDGLQPAAQVRQRVAICDDLAGVSDGHPTIAILFEERGVHDVKGTTEVRHDS